MVFEHIEKLKQEYTDKFVVVDERRPELSRFQGLTGTVRSVNMSGRALVEFDGFNNIGWYDIDVDFLKVIDQPLAKAEPLATAKAASAKKKAAKPAAKAKEPSALDKARGEKGKSAAGSKMSVQEMLAAARASAQGAGPEVKATAAADKPAAAAQPSPGKMSVQDILAAARAEKAGGAPEETPAADSPDGADEAKPSTESLPTTTAEIVAYCRRVDGGG